MSNVHQSVVDLVRARIGTTLKEKWHIDELLGVGGMAAVYAATHRTGSRVAIKMLHPQLSINDAVRKRFAREGYVANAIEHTGVARVLDDDVDADGSAFLVMELLHGETSSARAERLGGRLPVHEVAFIGDAVAEVLAAAHASHIVHRDIKPDNIFITNEGRVVVLDFGIARVADAAGISELGTRTGTMMGTPAFMPPEQARGRANEMDATSDVWALGATLFFLASGRVVHTAETPNEQLVAAATLPAASLARVAPDIPAPLVGVIDHALEYAKENRFPDAVAMQAALHQAIIEISWGPDVQPGIVPSVPGGPRPPSPKTRLGASMASGSHRPAGALGPTMGSGAYRPAMLTPASETPTTAHPTFGPVEMADQGSGRATKFLVAAVIGALVGGVALVTMFMMHRSPSNASTPSALAPMVSAAPSISEVASVAPPVSEVAPPPSPSIVVSAPLPSASTVVHPGLAAPGTGKKNWLDRRK